ncbi:division/cell wall cluster transcriptional repressor MraZ [Methylocucumis oryzae]|uniref:division/cell wall cluster transcriptional repressor MraZ n=1 Tax=Methylocucumis oryzae TaxID=1632867 RepID=UPI003083F8FF
MDTQGRLLIPEKLRKLAKLDKKLVLIGVGNKFEIWREDVYSAGEQAFMAGSDSEGLDELGDLSF